MRYLSLAFSLVLVSACGSSMPGGDDDDDTGGVDAGEGSDGGDGEWQTLIAGDWTRPAGTEGYTCVRTTVEENLYISDFRAINPLGTHHTVLAIDTVGGNDGVFDCNAGTLGQAAIFGSGVGTNEVSFPEGVAVKIEAGQQLLLNLHLFNVSDADLQDTSGTQVKTVPASEVEHEAEIVLMGSVVNLTVPPGESTQTGRCTMNGDVTVFAVNPHMHQLGTHMKIIAHSSVEGDVTLHDADYSFDEQLVYPVDPMVEMKQGDQLEVQCSYDNTTGSTVNFGDSTLDEMCFGTTYRYPVRGAQYSTMCDDDFPF